MAMILFYVLILCVCVARISSKANNLDENKNCQLSLSIINYLEFWTLVIDFFYSFFIGIELGLQMLYYGK